MRTGKGQEPTAVTVSSQVELGRETSFGTILSQDKAQSKYQEARAKAQADFLAYQGAGGGLDALRWMYTFRPAFFNQWVSFNSRGGHHDRYPMGRSRRDGARMVRGW